MTTLSDRNPAGSPTRERDGRIGWPLRLLFALCCAMIVFMALHGDEHGRRPRFIWPDGEGALKAAQLETGELKKAGTPFGIVPPLLAAETAAGGTFVPAGPVLVQTFGISRLPDAAAYLLPFGIGPPLRA